MIAVDDASLRSPATAPRAARRDGAALASCACPVHASVANLHGGKRAGRLPLEPEDVKNGLGQLVLTLVKLLHELLERQALRRIEAGDLSEAQIERLGMTLMRQADEIDRLRRAFNLDEDDLNLDLGPLGKLM